MAAVPAQSDQRFRRKLATSSDEGGPPEGRNSSRAVANRRHAHRSNPGEGHAWAARWGLAPFSTKIRRRCVNQSTRCETVASSPLFEEAFLRRCCLVTSTRPSDLSV
jgi:putative SOS response-associated peptidase YedK